MKWFVYDAQKRCVEFDGTFEANNLHELLELLAVYYNTLDSGCYQLATLKWGGNGYGWLPYEYALTRTSRTSWHVYDCQWNKDYTVEL